MGLTHFNTTKESNVKRGPTPTVSVTSTTCIGQLLWVNHQNLAQPATIPPTDPDPDARIAPQPATPLNLQDLQDIDRGTMRHTNAKPNNSYKTQHTATFVVYHPQTTTH